ncbi:MAG: hypothetical protein WD795_06995 [Woeseia sp.]
MQDDNGNDAAAGQFAYADAEPVPPDDAASLRFETQAAAGAVVAHIRKVAATATTEAELSIASVTAMAVAALASILLLVAGWLCLIAAGVWLAVDAGLPVVTALLIAGAINIAAVLLLLVWGKRLLGNIGFSRTRKLVFPGSQ